MSRPTRRQLFTSIAAGLSILGTGSVPERTKRFVEQHNASGRFPLPRIVDAQSRDWTIDRTASSGDQTVRLTGPDAPLVHRVWDLETTSTVEVHEVKPNEDDIPVGTGGEGTIDSIYRPIEDDTFEYLFDVGVPGSVRTAVQDRVSMETNDHFDREFTEHTIELSWHADPRTDLSATLEVPYSLYQHAQGTNTSGPIPNAPYPKDNRFDRYDHGGLVQTIDRVADQFADRADSSEYDYWKVAKVAEFVQSFPHAIDWESSGKPHHIRSPAEMAVELTADCKDAALLTFDLLQALDYDPVLVLLVGDVTEEIASLLSRSDNESRENEWNESEEDKDKGEIKFDGEEVSMYPNHTAVGIPLSRLGALPDELEDIASTIDHDGEEYLYIESTFRASPGIYEETRARSRAVLYNSRRNFASDLLPV